MVIFALLLGKNHFMIGDNNEKSKNLCIIHIRFRFGI